MTNSRPALWTRRLALFTAVCSVVFTIGTALHAFAVVDAAMIEEMMRRAGAADPAGAAPGFTSGFRAVGVLYIAGNALGVALFWTRRTWLYWPVLAVNATQALGWVAIPPQMWAVAAERHGPVGVLPSAVTDGGAVVLTLVLVVGFIRWRRARRKA